MPDPDTQRPVSLMGTIQTPITIKDSKEATIFYCQISAPDPTSPIADLIQALNKNREHLNKIQTQLSKNMRREYIDGEAPGAMNYEGPIQNALVSRYNINVLIPLINIKGGQEEFSQIESLPVNIHIQAMLGQAKNQAIEFEETTHHFKHTTIVSIFVIAFVFLYIYFTS